MDPVPPTDSSKEFLSQSKITTPYERQNLPKETPYQFSGQETDDWIKLRDGAKERRIPLTKVFDQIAEDERVKSGKNDWQTSRELLNYYLSRNTYEECGQIGSLELHNALVQIYTKKCTAGRKIQISW